jgi:hypothetical protein
MKIIGVCGKKQSGKDSFANFVGQILPHKKVGKVSLAKPLKDFVHANFNVPLKNLWGTDAEKNYPLCTWGEIFTKHALEAYKRKSNDLLNGREILQVVGTDAMRQNKLFYLEEEFRKRTIEFLRKFLEIEPYGRGEGYDRIWVDLLKRDIDTIEARKEADILIIPDVRFFNELNAIKEWGGVLVRLFRHTGSSDSIPHPSELEMEEMDDSLFNYVAYEHENKNLNQLRRFTTRVLMTEDLIGFGGMAV